MNWGRGFFRLWIVISVIYVVLVVAFSASIWPSDHTSYYSNTTKRYEQVAKTPAIRRQEIQTHLVNTAWFIFGGPASLLAIGVAIGWIAGGFRRNA